MADESTPRKQYPPRWWAPLWLVLGAVLVAVGLVGSGTEGRTTPVVAGACVMLVGVFWRWFEHRSRR